MKNNIPEILFFLSLFPNSSTLILILLLQPKHSSRREKKTYICGLRTRIECERVSEHSTHSDRVTNIGFLLSSGASPLPAANQNSLVLLPYRWYYIDMKEFIEL